MRYETGLANRLGNRDTNQDRCSVVERERALLALVADGMGGHARGELAAETAIESITRAFEAQPLPIADPPGFLSQAIQQAHQDINTLGQREDPPVMPRTTIVACVIQGMRAWWAHVGDSRLYLSRGGNAVAQTRDHTYVEELFQHGVISEAEMRTHPMRNYVIHCLGGPDTPPVELGEATALQFDDVVLLCSDGLWGALPEAQFLAPLGRGELEPALDRIAQQAEEAAYPSSDNIGVAAVRILAQQDIDTETDEAADSGTDAEPGSPPGTLDEAIAAIRHALHQYDHELDRD